MKESWKDVKGYEGFYEVSNLGRVRSVERVISQVSRAGNTYSRVLKSKVLSPVVGSNGRYHYVHLAKVKKEHCSVHSLVLRAFVGEPSPGQEGCHNDGDSFNNRLSNLRWDTHLSNEQDRKKHGTHIKGEKHKLAVYSEEQIRQVKADLGTYTGKKYGMYVALAAKHAIPAKYIGEIHRGKKWAHIPSLKH